MNKMAILIVFVVIALVTGACGLDVNLGVDRGSGNVITQTRDVSGFDRVSLSGIGDVELVQGDREELRIEAEDNIIEQITTEVVDGELRIGFDRKTIIPTKDITFYLTMREVRGLHTQGVSNITANQINTDTLDIGISGTGNIDIRQLEAQEMKVNVSGAGNFNAEGQVQSQQISLSGAGNYEGEDLQSATASVTITGLGRVTLWVTDDLDVTISGTGGVDYYGNPQVSQQISGLGRVRHQGDK